MKTLKEALINERTISASEITDYISLLLSNCKNTSQLRMICNSISNGFENGLAKMNEKHGDDWDMCETASEIIEIFQSTCNRLLK